MVGVWKMKIKDVSKSEIADENTVQDRGGEVRPSTVLCQWSNSERCEVLCPANRKLLKKDRVQLKGLILKAYQHNE